MGKVKIKRTFDEKEVIYSENQWELLKRLRSRAIPVLKCLSEAGLEGYIYGSIARGDVSETSDIDIFIHDFIASYRIDLALLQCGIPVSMKEIVLPTPGEVIKGIYYLSNEVSITLRLTDFMKNGMEFYKFAGWINLKDVLGNKRVPGVNKALITIIPTQTGHKEVGLISNEVTVKNLLGISLNMVHQRERVLKKRDKEGRTGLFFRQQFDESANLEYELNNIAKKNNIIRRRMNL